MTRKIRNDVTEDVKKLAKRLSEDNTKTFTRLAEIADLNRNSVSKTIRHLPTSSPRSLTSQTIFEERPRRVSLEDQIILIIVC
jgi:hypothetical protein